ncbi:hypothetical protein [Heyndrickxia camelliae]|uniref:hypothetical protein n=1 Tax=Heyndrickxia camelliae TaxID=1707093 RepID=UPI0013FD55B6|nr:hypothetical protein [Heyndrickxia camelliae]
MENIEGKIEGLENLVEDLILKLGRANHQIYNLTKRLDSLEKDNHSLSQTHYHSKVVSL